LPEAAAGRARRAGQHARPRQRQPRLPPPPASAGGRRARAQRRAGHRAALAGRARPGLGRPGRDRRRWVPGGSRVSGPGRGGVAGGAAPAFGGPATQPARLQALLRGAFVMPWARAPGSATGRGPSPAARQGTVPVLVPPGARPDCAPVLLGTTVTNPFAPSVL